MNHSVVKEDDREKQKMLHDLRGPLINAAAFNNELTEAIERLSEFLNDGNTELSAKACVEIREILQEDVIPCNRFVGTAVTQMQERLDKFGR